MRAVCVDHASGTWVVCLRGLVYVLVQRQGLAGLVAADLHALGIDLGQASRVKLPEARIAWRDEVSIVEPNADVASSGVDIATRKQALANAADLIACVCFVHAHCVTDCANWVKALLKKSSLPKLPDLSAM